MDLPTLFTYGLLMELLMVTYGFANQGKSLVMFSFPIPLFLKKDLSFLLFKVWRYVFFLVA